MVQGYSEENFNIGEIIMIAKKHFINWKKIVNQDFKPNDTRSLLGVSGSQDWLEGFDIGSIMHMSTVIYGDFVYFGDMIYEISKRMIIEKIVYISISYFTLATEIRF